LIQTGETGLLNESVKIEETFALAALKTVGDWAPAHGEMK
jgi:hypothetical protein